MTLNSNKNNTNWNTMHSQLSSSQDSVLPLRRTPLRPPTSQPPPRMNKVDAPDAPAAPDALVEASSIPNASRPT